MEDEDKSQKTELPSERRLEEAIEKGQVVHSRELTTFLMFLTITLVLTFSGEQLAQDANLILKDYIEFAHDIDPVNGDYFGFYGKIIYQIFSLLAIPLLATCLIAILSSFVQTGRFIFTIEPIMPKLEKISLKKGFERIFSTRSLFEFFKGILKIIIIAFACFVAIKPYFTQIVEIFAADFDYINHSIFILSFKILLTVTVIMAFIAGVDYFFQRKKYIESLMMSKRDVKQEYKETEGSPEIKAKIKALRQQKSRKRMMANVPTADVIITNPTHYSVALKYEDGTMDAPKVVAKGLDLLALKIREIAKAHDIPIVENPPLARSLYKLCEIDQEIPVSQYKAVAEVISYVYKLKNKKRTLIRT